MLTRAVFVAAAFLLAGCGAPATPTSAPSPAASPMPATEPSPNVPASAPPSTPLRASPARSPSASPARSPAGSPDSSPAVAGDWLYLADFPVGEAIEVAGATVHADGFVAVGFEPYPGEGFGGRRNGVVWTSADGRSWARAVPPELGSTSVRSVVSLDGQLYAFGDYSICPELSEEEECADAADAGNALWRSADGASWQRLALPDGLRMGILDAALSDGTQLIVHGSTGEELLGAVWRSPDGEQWSELRDLGGVDPINALEAGAGRLVAFGLRYLPEDDDVETLAAYSDGGAFAPASLPTDQRGVVQDVAWAEGAFVAVGVAHALTADRPAWLALASADGLSWTAAPAAQLPLGATLHHVLAVPGGYLALGALPAEQEARELPHSWFSTDGFGWTDYGQLTGGAYRQLTSSASGPAGVVVFATDFEASDEMEPVEPEPGTVHGWLSPLSELPDAARGDLGATREAQPVKP